MQRVQVVQYFPQPVDELFAYLSEQENLEPLFGAKIKRLSDGSDGAAASSRTTRASCGSRRTARDPAWITRSTSTARRPASDRS
jgi:hypothetical protein